MWRALAQALTRGRALPLAGNMRAALFALVALAALSYVVATCPNQCSGHGNCADWDRCTCFKRKDGTTDANGKVVPAWTGPDCSLRKSTRRVGLRPSAHSYAHAHVLVCVRLCECAFSIVRLKLCALALRFACRGHFFQTDLAWLCAGRGSCRYVPVPARVG